MYWTSLDSQFRFTVLFFYTAVDECNHIILIWFLVIVSLVTSAGPTGVRKLLVPCLIDKWNFCSMQFNLSNVFVCPGPADPSGSKVSDHLPSLTSRHVTSRHVSLSRRLCDGLLLSCLSEWLRWWNQTHPTRLFPSVFFWCRWDNRVRFFF